MATEPTEVSRAALKIQYDEQRPYQEKLAELVKENLKHLLQEHDIVYSNIETRVKSFESFFQKALVNGFSNPFQDIQDLCGIRVILYYLSDLQKLTEVIKQSFEIIESVDKLSVLEDNEFGYRSYHFVGYVKDSWLQDPATRSLKKRVFEIQTRTLLMHSWAAIEHKLAYKPLIKEPVAPEVKRSRFRRDLFALSALIELADREFDQLKAEQERLKNSD